MGGEAVNTLSLNYDILNTGVILLHNLCVCTCALTQSVQRLSPWCCAYGSATQAFTASGVDPVKIH